MARYAEGTAVLFYQKAELRLGMIAAMGARGCGVLDLDGVTIELTEKRFVLSSQTPLLPASGEALHHFTQEVEAAGKAFSSEHIQELLGALNKAFSFEEACAVLNLNSDAQRFAFFLYLKQNEEIFAPKKGLYQIRNAEERQAFLNQREQSRQREHYLAEVAEYLESFGKGESPHLEEGMRERLKLELRSLQLQNGSKDLARILRAGLEGMEAYEARLKELRLALGDVFPDTDPMAAESGIPVAFKPGLEKKILDAELVVQNPAKTASGKSSEAFSIDIAGTLDFDDAISLTPRDEGWTLGIHISDVAGRIPAQSELFVEARQRAASLYLPGESISLLPETLTRSEFPLLAGTEKPALSLYVELDRELCLGNYEFRLDRVKITRNYSYQDFDAELSDPSFAPLYRLAQKLARERDDDEKSEISRFYWQLKVQNGEITMIKTDNLSPSRSIVEELMILYNRLFAKRATESGLPFLYRNVAGFEENEETEPRAQIQAYLSTEARFHPGVGSEAYLHASSPIRRFADIVNQMQFQAFLQGQTPALGKDELESLIPELEKRLLLLRQVARRSESYWLLRFLQQKHLGEPLDLILLKRLRQGYLAELTRWEKRLVLHCDSLPPLQTPVKAVLTSVDLKELSATAEFGF